MFLHLALGFGSAYLILEADWYLLSSLTVSASLIFLEINLDLLILILYSVVKVEYELGFELLTEGSLSVEDSSKWDFLGFSNPLYDGNIVDLLPTRNPFSSYTYSEA